MRTITSDISKSEYLCRWFRVFRKAKSEGAGWWWECDVLAVSSRDALSKIKREEGYMYKAKELEVWELRNLK